MTCYAIGHLTITNKDWLPEYSKRIAPLLAQYGGNIIAKGQPKYLEGNKTLADIELIIAFETEARAKAWYDSDENKALVALRQQGSQFELSLVEGV